MKKPYLFPVDFPLSQYNENVLELARINKLVIVEAYCVDDYSLVADNLPALTVKGEMPDETEDED